MGQCIAHHLVESGIGGHDRGGLVSGRKDRRTAKISRSGSFLQSGKLRQQPFNRSKNLLLQDAVLKGVSELVAEPFKNFLFRLRQIWDSRPGTNPEDAQNIPRMLAE